MKDYLIVGFGIAGLHVAHQLQKRNLSFTVIDNGKKNASKVAGGIINPLILKRFTPVWWVDEFLPLAKAAYQETEELLQEKCFYEIPVYRKIKSVREQNDWFTASDKPELHPYMDDQLRELPQIKAPFKFGKVKQTAFVNTQKLISAYRDKLLLQQQYRTEEFDYAELKIDRESVTYRDLTAQKIIFCEGIGLLKNPFLNKLPLIGNKGEYLRLKIPNLHLKATLKTAVALIPLGEDCYKFGATYSRSFKNDKPEEENREFLIKKLEEVIDLPYSVTGCDTGIRPTVPDRRPFAGRHPEYPNLLILNGLGSHGVLTAPAVARWLIDFDRAGFTLPKEINVRRYFK